MTTVPAGLAAESAILKQNVTLSVIKQSHDQQQRLVEILSESARSAPLSGTRGSNVNITA